MTRSITKYGVTVRRREDLGKIIKMAFYIAQTGKPGSVLIDIPKDIQTASGSAEYPSHVDIRGYKPIHGVHIGQLKKAYKMLKSAKKPLILAGGGVNISHAGEKLKKFMEKENVPVVTTIMGKGAVPTTHPLYIGNCGMHGKYAANMAVMECDLLFSIGTRFNDRITGDLNEFAPHAQIVHIDVDTASISRNVVVDVPVVADAGVALEKLLEWAEKKGYGKVAGTDSQVGERESACHAQGPWDQSTDDHGAHQCTVSTQYLCDGCRAASDVGNPVSGTGRTESAHHIRRTGNDGIRISGRNRGKNCKSKETGRVYHGRWRISDEYSGDGNGGNTGYRNYDLSAEQ